MNKLHTIYTAQYRYSGTDRFDITVKGQDGMGKHFAPTWNMVMDHKNGIITDQQYIDQYIPILQSIPVHVWDWFLNAEVRTLVCFCQRDAFCHRNLVVQFIQQTLGSRIAYGGFRETVG